MDQEPREPSDLSLICHVCGNGADVTCITPAQVELFMTIWKRNHTHPKHEVQSWYEAHSGHGYSAEDAEL